MVVASTPELPKPRLRGVVHQWAFFVACALGAALVLTAPDGRATVAATIYAASVAGLFGASALYHRVTWSRAAARVWMRRLDHSMIFVLIAGSYTPFALLVLDGALATVILLVAWIGAALGIVLKLLWIGAPNWVSAAVYMALGWLSIVTLPALAAGLGVVGITLVAVGGVLYTVGAVVYASQRPDPVPTVFGYHEIFHVLVVVAAALQYAVVAFWVLPG